MSERQFDEKPNSLIFALWVQTGTNRYNGVEKGGKNKGGKTFKTQMDVEFTGCSAAR